MERSVEESKSYCRQHPGNSEALIHLVHRLRSLGHSNEIPDVLQLEPIRISLLWRLLGKLVTARFASDGSVLNMQRLAKLFRRPINRGLANMNQALLRAELALGLLGDEKQFLRLLEVKRTTQDRLIRCLGMSSAPVRYMGNYWVRKIGHLGQIEFYFRPWKLGLLAPFRPVVLIKTIQEVANRPLLDYWRRYFDIIVDPIQFERRALEARLLEIDIHLYESSDPYRPAIFYKDADALAWQRWETEQRQPTLTLDPKHLEAGRATLQALGIPPGAWFVTFHVREPGFAGDSGPGPRNASIENYILAMQEVVARGGYVVRLGNPKMKPLPNMPSVLDLAHTEGRSEELDIYVLAACRFFVGMASGPAQIPHLFGVPTVYTNWIPIPDYPFHGNALLIHKHHLDKVTGRRLPYQRFVGLHTDYQNKDEGIVFEENTANEIRDVLIEMLDRLDGRVTQASPEDERQQEQFRALAGIPSAVGRPQLGRTFLRSNADLFDASP